MPFKNRFPKLQEITSVYAVNVVILYSFSIVFSLQDATRNWILYLGIEDILAIFTYIIFGAFLESLLITSFLIFIYILLPRSLVQRRFVLYGTILTIAFLLALMLRSDTSARISNTLRDNNMVFSFFGVTTLILALVAEWSKIIRSAIETFADRCMIFLYIYMPISLLSAIGIVVRNIR